MDVITNFLIDWGYWGMLVSAFLAGSFFPFSSEAIMLALMAAGLQPWPLVIYGTAGNVLGSVFNYWVGRLGKPEWIERYLHVKQDELDKAERFMHGRGALMGFFSFLPILGSAITIVLGLMRSNFFISMFSITMGKFIRYIVLVLSVASLSSCTPSKSEHNNTITVTIDPIRYFTEEIAGEKYKVITMVPQGSNPETYEPTAQQMIALSHSNLYIKVGNLGFERTWMSKLKANAPEITIIDSSKGIVTAKSINGIDDPHTWMSTKSAIIIAQNIYEALKEKDSKDSSYFRKNLNKLILKIKNTDQQIRAKLAGKKNASFLIYHPALTYFARDYSLHQLPIEEEGREPSAQQIKDIITAARKEGVKTMFVQKEFKNRNTQIVVQSTEAEIKSINPLSYDWANEMINIANKLK
jgi:ABC-type Zn uptake system ZnuABC Zn-binding protein ZnuA